MRRVRKGLRRIIVTTVGIVLTASGLVRAGEIVLKIIQWVIQLNVEIQPATIVNFILVALGVVIVVFANWRKGTKDTPPQPVAADIEKYFGKFNSLLTEVGRCVNQAIANISEESDPARLSDLVAHFAADLHGCIVSILGRTEGNAFKKFCDDQKDQSPAQRQTAISSYILGLERRQLSSIKKQVLEEQGSQAMTSLPVNLA